MSDIVERLKDEADLCISDGADDCAALIDKAAETILALRAEVEALRGIVGGVVKHFSGCAQGPGHSHDVPGVWDMDNHPGLAGQPCEWCAHWGLARTALSTTEAK